MKLINQTDELSLIYIVYIYLNLYYFLNQKNKSDKNNIFCKIIKIFFEKRS